MNKSNKRQVFILAGLLLGLVVAVFVQFSGGKKNPASPATGGSVAATATAGAAAAATQPAEAPQEKEHGMHWIDQRRVVVLTAEVAGGRDPFADLLGAIIGTIRPPAAATKAPDPIPIADVKPLPVFNNNNTQPLPVSTPGTTEPYTPAPVRPSIPSFTLSGVMTNMETGERFASLVVNGRYYTSLMEGETIPGLGWTVIAIDASSVKLKKDTDIIQVRLPGGSPK